MGSTFDDRKKSPGAERFRRSTTRAAMTGVEDGYKCYYYFHICPLEVVLRRLSHAVPWTAEIAAWMQLCPVGRLVLQPVPKRHIALRFQALFTPGIKSCICPVYWPYSCCCACPDAA